MYNFRSISYKFPTRRPSYRQSWSGKIIRSDYRQLFKNNLDISSLIIDIKIINMRTIQFSAYLSIRVDEALDK